jgi:peroxiredoxin
MHIACMSHARCGRPDTELVSGRPHSFRHTPHHTRMSTTLLDRTPAVGDAAPDFTLPSTGGQTVTLSDLRGKGRVLVAFFPLAFTSTCTEEVCGFSEDFDAFAGHGVTILPISVDSVPTLKEFKAKYDLKVDFLSDFKRDASRAYGVLLPATYFSTRAYFLLDEEGIVRWEHVESNPGARRDNAEILAEIAKLG